VTSNVQDAAIRGSPAAVTPPSASVPPPAKPISGFSLMAKVLWNAIKGLFGGRPSA
jgi:hypothetical protein